MKAYICLDIENDNNPETRYGRKAGNFLFDKIVAVGWKDKHLVQSLYTNEVPRQFYKGYDLIIGHNLIHDLLFLWKDSWLQDWLKAGGRIHDTMYAEYLLSGQQLTYKDLGLRKLAVEKYGCKEREKKMEKYWDEGKLTSEIPKELVLEDVSNDVLDTEQIYLKQIEALEEAGMTNLFEGIMDFELATIEMTYNGMFINKEIFEKNKAALKQELLNREIEFLDKIRGIK